MVAFESEPESDLWRGHVLIELGFQRLCFRKEGMNISSLHHGDVGTPDQRQTRLQSDRVGLMVLIFISLFASTFGVLQQRLHWSGSLFTLSNLVGPTAQSLINHNGLNVCTTAMGTAGNPICF